MISYINQSGKVQYNVVEMVADTRADLELLSEEKCAPGSVLFVIEDSSVWMRKSDGSWHRI